MKVFSDSLSFGMRDAIDAGCEDEVVILTACKFSNEAELEKILCRYTEVYWQRHPTAADAVRRAYAEGRIIVPRNEGYCCPIGSSGQPLYTDWTEWQWELARHAPRWQMGWCPRQCQVTEEQVKACSSIKETYQLFPEKCW
jgi:hypothetical protein